MTFDARGSRRAANAYVEQRVLTAGPARLVQLLIARATSSTHQAREAIASDRVREAGESISRAFAIVGELRSALDHEQGGDVAKQLEQLYDFVSRRLTEANRRRETALLDEALEVLVRLEEAWNELSHS